MAQAGGAKTERYEVRLTGEGLETLRLASELSGRSIAEIMTTAAKSEAERIIEAETLIRLSVEDQRRFAESLLTPLSLPPTLKRAEAAHTRLIRKTS